MRREERTERRGGKSSQSSQGARRGTDNRSEELGTRKKKPLNKRIRSSNSSSDMDQDQQRMRKARKKEYCIQMLKASKARLTSYPL